MIGFTSAANALLVTVLQSRVLPPLPLPLVLSLLQAAKISIEKDVMMRERFVFILLFLFQYFLNGSIKK
jgi:hypothetical protein